MNQIKPGIAREKKRGFFRSWARALGAVLLGAWFGWASPEPAWCRPLQLQAPPVHINDGDTFEADLDGNGRLDLPRERVRLLYVDTPELHESHKGQDLKHGLPAREFLRAALQRLPLTLHSPGHRKFDKFGRRLAVVRAGAVEVNLQLVRRGHSYFDTRFRFPPNYEAYAAAEGAAFGARLGIWSEPASRKAYLARLRKEGKTPRGAANPLYGGAPRETGSLRPEKWVGKFLRVRGQLLERKIFRRGARKLLFTAPRGKKPFEVYVSNRVARKLPVDGWPLNARVEMDGFVKLYRKTPQLTLHHGRVVE